MNKRFIGKLKHSSLLEKAEEGLTKCRWCGKGVLQEELCVQKNVYMNLN